MNPNLDQERVERAAMDANAACERISAMWASLGEQISAAIPDIVIEGKPEEAIRWAQCAEACFWQATGDAASHDVKDVAAPSSATPTVNGKGE